MTVLDPSQLLSIPKKGPVVAIDGPAGTGKSSATKRLCERLGFTHVDTGALYRSVAYLLLKERGALGTGWEAFAEADMPLVQARAKEIAETVELEFRREPKKNPANRIWANGKDITPYIRTPEVSICSSRVSAIPSVRQALLALQRTMGGQGRTILEGRDIGTVIFPDADVKFFLTASIEERAKRRLYELEGAGADAPSYEEVKRQIADRDRGDMTRAVAPLRKAEDALELDTSTFTLDEVVDWMEKKVREKLGLVK
ncbi:MAG: (d)CMP kinase [Bdellovibrionales bacterium]|nr:(d)CMP kinase [Bdellovibrionales bacterium]